MAMGAVESKFDFARLSDTISIAGFGNPKQGELKMIIMIGTTIYDHIGNEYRVTEFVGNGSFGYVYKIARKSDGEVFALKTLQTSLRDNVELKAFLNEGNLALTISHLNVIKYLYFHDGSKYRDLPPYIIMEFASEGTLEGLLEAKRATKETFSSDKLIEYFSQLIAGMEAINQYLIHRDIKPDNILIAGDLLKIADFGLSKIVAQSTRTATFKGRGCIPYLAPEGWNFEKNTIQMDIYSMGFVFYELATLQHPFANLRLVNFDDWRNAHLFQAPLKPQDLNPQLSSIISQVILKMIEKSRTERFQNWGDVRRALQKEEVPKTLNSANVDAILGRRLAKDHKIKQAQLERERIQKHIDEHKKLVAYQYQKSIFEPIKEFIDEFNVKYDARKVEINPLSYEIGCAITLVSSNWIKIIIKELIDENLHRDGSINVYDATAFIKKLKQPIFNKSQIMAWGGVVADKGRGFNLLLVKNDDDVYGEWLVMINTNSKVFGSQERIPEPFCFSLNELEKELELLNTGHQYRTSIERLALNHFIRLIDEFI